MLLAYSTDRLDTDDAIRVRRHLESCPACSAWVEKQSAVWQALDVWEAPPVSADFDRRLYQRIEQQVSWWDRLLQPLRPVLNYRTLPIAAAAGLLIAAGVFLDREASVPPPPRVDSAKVQVETLQPDQVEHAIDEVEMLNQFNRLMRADPADTNSKM